jgi:plasmid stabilization system protein ParE
MTVRFHPAARAELVSACDWYERARAGLGTVFASEIERLVALVEEHPERFPHHDSRVRRASLRRFPFSIYFEDVDGVRHIWAVFHHRRNPTTIEHRLGH